MTSFSVSHYPSELTRGQLQTLGLALTAFEPRPTLGTSVGPGELSMWARAEGLTEFYVDNCWVRVPAGGAQLRAFLKARALPEHANGLWEAAIDDDARYLLEAEEF